MCRSMALRSPAMEVDTSRVMLCRESRLVMVRNPTVRPMHHTEQVQPVQPMLQPVNQPTARPMAVDTCSLAQPTKATRVATMQTTAAVAVA